MGLFFNAAIGAGARIGAEKAKDEVEKQTRPEIKEVPVPREESPVDAALAERQDADIKLSHLLQDVKDFDGMIAILKDNTDLLGADCTLAAVADWLNDLKKGDMDIRDVDSGFFFKDTSLPEARNMFVVMPDAVIKKIKEIDSLGKVKSSLGMR